MYSRTSENENFRQIDNSTRGGGQLPPHPTEISATMDSIIEGLLSAEAKD